VSIHRGHLRLVVTTPTVKRGPLSPEEKAEIARLAERGLKPGQIAQRLNRNRSTIGFHMAVRGMRKIKPSPETAVDIKRGDQVVRHFTREEDAFIEALRIQKFTCQAIAEWSERRFGHRRSAATICSRLKMIAAREEATND
jgi:hypothetical protein